MSIENYDDTDNVDVKDYGFLPQGFSSITFNFFKGDDD